MGNNKHDEGSVDDFRKTLTDLIRLNDERGSRHPGSNPASRPRHPQHRPVYPNPGANQNRPTMPGHVAEPPSQYRHLASRAPMPTKPRESRRQMLEGRISSAMAQLDQYSGVDSGMKAQAGLFAGGLLVACVAAFVLVSYLVTDDVTDDSVTEASSHFQAPTTAQATLGISSPDVSTADAKALSDIANGSWLVLPSDVKKPVRTEGATSVQQQTASLAPSGPNAMTRQELFGSFQTYLEKTDFAHVTSNRDQEALFNSFIRWSEEVAEAN